MTRFFKTSLSSVTASLGRRNIRLSSSFSRNKLGLAGVLETPRSPEEPYPPGQLFLHRLLGYRGVVLCPWEAPLFSREASDNGKRVLRMVCQHTGKASALHHITRFRVDVSNPTHNTYEVLKELRTEVQQSEGRSGLKETAGKKVVYYQALMDQRDLDHIGDMTYVHNVTERGVMCGMQRNVQWGIRPIAGVDYVAHEDMIPYSCQDEAPILSGLFEEFFRYDPTATPPYVARPVLQQLNRLNGAWLLTSAVYRYVTEDMIVTVTPIYVGCRLLKDFWRRWWRICLLMEYKGDQPVVVTGMCFRIHCSHLFTIAMQEGMAYKERVLCAKEQPVIHYSQYVSLIVPHGTMWGSYTLQRPDGSSYEGSVPPCLLDSRLLDRME